MEDDNSKINNYEVALRNAFKRIKNLSEKLKECFEPIAIIGMGCRFPGGGNNPEEFWNVLKSGIDGIKEVPRERFNIDDYFNPEFDVPGKMYTRSGGFLNVPVDLFDADFFGISPKEAEEMDPQQRLLLEVAWEALEDSLIPPETLEGSLTGVYVGMMYSDYSQLILESQGFAGIGTYYNSGNAFSAAVGRISYILGLQGPCMAIDTACSSSLVAINSACESLRLGQCEQALAGGVSLMLSPGSFISACEAHMLAPDGHCKTFDKSADGYARAEGCGILVLKRLSDAIHDGDRIYAMIQSSGVNQGGTTSGLTVPNGEAQESLIRQVYSEVGLKPDDIDFVEAHGTGTSLGDPIEVRAIGAAYGNRDPDHPLLIGSAKSNIGHSESAAGVAGMIKTILSLNHQMVPANYNFKELNPNIELNFPVKILTENTPWLKGDRVRRAGVSSFGFSGINAHIIIEESPSIESQFKEVEERPLHILTLSAKSESALNALIQSYQAYLDQTEVALPDICYSANTGRNHWKYRIALIAKNLNEFKEKLNKGEFLKGEALEAKSYEFIQTGDWKKDLSELANAYIKGANIDWKKFDAPYPRRKVSLPTYPFQRKSFWSPQLRKKSSEKLKGTTLHPLLGFERDSASEEIVFEQIVNLDDFPYIAGHAIYDSVILPGTGFVELMQAALFHLSKGPCQLNDVRIEKPFLIKPMVDYVMQVIAVPNENGWSFSVYSRISKDKDADWINHATATGSAADQTDQMAAVSPKLLQQISESILNQRPLKDFYVSFSQLGYQYGADFRGLKGVLENQGEHWGFIIAPSSIDLDKYLFHPALFDIALHSIIAISLDLFKSNPYLPISIDQVVFYKPFSAKVWVKVKPHISNSEETFTNDCFFYNEFGECCGFLKGLTAKKATPENLKKLLQEGVKVSEWLYEITWQPKSANASEINEEPWLVLSNYQPEVSFAEDFRNKLHSDILMVNLNDISMKNIAEAIERQKYFGVLVLINALEFSNKSEPNLKQSGLYFLLFMAQALGKFPEMPITVVTLNDHFLSEMIAGFCRCWRLEESERVIKHLQFYDSPLRSELIIKELFNESIDNEIRYDGEERSVARLGRVSENQPFNHDLNLSPECSYIITGGLGGLGLTLAEWCVDHGAKFITLCSRGAPNQHAKNLIDQLIVKGTQINVKSIDISRQDQVEALVSDVSKIAPLKGIFHLAGSVRQGFIKDQSTQLFEDVFTSKALGAWYLHLATNNLSLDHFVLFSSITSALGAPGGSNYAVANAYLDSLADYRRSMGLSANSLQWGPWGEVGMMKDLSESKQIPGLIKMSPAKALDALNQLLLDKQRIVTLIANIHWKEIPKRMPTQPLWESFIVIKKAITEDLMTRLLSLDADERADYLRLYLRKILQDVLKLPEASVSLDDRGFFDLGFDSLMSAEFHRRLSDSLGKEHKLVNTLIFDYPNINAVTNYLMQSLGLKEKAKIDIKRGKKENENDQIAIIGMSCRFPGGANSPEAYWNLLVEGRNINQIIPKDRWDAEAYYDSDRNKEGKMYVKRGHFLNIPIDQFDNDFFHISLPEAEFMDPQQRLLLELSWEAFENAGIDPLQLKGSQTGVFIGIMNQDYHSLMERIGGLNSINRFTGVGGDFLGGPGRISFFYNIRGPSEPVLTACSSSLIATHLAVNSLQKGECNLALAGGVNLMLDPSCMITYSKMGLLSPDGLCKTFDISANGYGRGEGIGLVVLKRLSDAERDQDDILAVICGSSMNHNGESSGLTVPSGQAQQELYQTALKSSKLPPESISFIEAHGTGTAVGDPIETGSIKEIYGGKTRQIPLWIGAVKSNIGHLEGAAGIASLIKTILCIKHREIPSQLHFHNLNPAIDLSSIPAKIPVKATKWESFDGQYVAGVNSFGATGVNAHVIIRQPPPIKSPIVSTLPDRSSHILTLAAKTEQALKDLIVAYQHFLEKTNDNLANIVYTANAGRSHFGLFGYRTAVVAKNNEELIKRLLQPDLMISKVEAEKETKITFEYVKQGSYSIHEEQRGYVKIDIGPEINWDEFMHILSLKFLKGGTIDWKALEAPYSRQKVAIPNYPFQRRRIWAEILDVSQKEEHKNLDLITPTSEQLLELFEKIQKGIISVETLATKLIIKNL